MKEEACDKRRSKKSENKKKEIQFPLFLPFLGSLFSLCNPLKEKKKFSFFPRHCHLICLPILYMISRSVAVLFSPDDPRDTHSD